MMKSLSSSLARFPVWLWGALLFLVVTGVFSASLRHDFVDYDDQILIYENKHYLKPGGPDLAYFWKKPHEQLWMPLTYSIWGWTTRIARLEQPLILDESAKITFSAQPFHALNLVLHGCNALWVFAIVQLLIQNRHAALMGALLFGVHPFQVQSVVWAAELKGVLGAFWVLGSLWFYLQYAANDAREDDKPRFKRKICYALSIIFCALALLSKPNTVVLPLALLSIEVLLFSRTWSKRFWSLAPFFAMALAGSFAARWAQPVNSQIPTVALWARPLVAGDALAFYMGRFAWPVSLGINYGRRPDWLLQQPWAGVMWIFPALLAWLCWRSREPKLQAAFLLWLAFLLPVLGFLPFSYQSSSTVADRYMYLPLLGAALVLAWAIERFGQRGALSKALCLAGAWMLLLGWLSVSHTGHWQNTRMLFTQAYKVNPNSSYVQFEMGNLFRAEGKLAEALGYYQEAARFETKDHTVFSSLGDTFLALGHTQEAIGAFERAVQIKPDSAKSHYNLANALAAQEQWRKAEEHFRTCLRLDASFVEAYNNLAIVLARQNRRPEAIQAWQRSLQLRPDNPEAHFNLANALMKANQASAAISHYRAVLRLAPDFPPARAALQRALRQNLLERKPHSP
jgi:tetratricopeptide (TPR) repeat protein